MEINIERGLKEALALMELGNPRSALEIITPLFENDLECQELIYSNRCCTFWLDTIRRLRSLEHDPYEQSEKILSEWKSLYHIMTEGSKEIYQPALYAVQKGYFSNALEIYTKQLEDKDPLQKAEMYKKAGICYKKLGNFENARNFLTEANNIYQNLASVLAELADCYALCGEDRIGKLLFREAFFTDPESIDLEFLDSELIKCLIRQTTEKGHTGKALQYWIPVYGVLYGVFNIKRALSAQEVARLRKNIFAMESEYKDPSCNAEILVPKLLNSYFWQIDNYLLTNENGAKINDTLLRIKILDSSVYEQYTK